MVKFVTDQKTAKGWKNKNGTASRHCKCGTWIDHWRRFSGRSWPDECSVDGCTKTAKLGAHVYSSSVSGEYIVPMCNSCNKQGNEFDLNVGVTAVSANRSETCEK